MQFVFDGGFAAEAGVDAAAVVEVFDPGGDPDVDLVAGGRGTSVVLLGFEGGPAHHQSVVGRPFLKSTAV